MKPAGEASRECGDDDAKDRLDLHSCKSVERSMGVAGQGSTVSQPGDRPSFTIHEAISQQALMLTVPPASLPLMFTPVKEGQQLLASFSSVPCGPPSLTILCSSLIVHPSANHGLLVLQQQVTNASNQALVPSTLSAMEWQEMVQAAEALLALKYASQALPGPNSPGQYQSIPRSLLCSINTWTK
ncbi:doublesex- and mab-3-related transcription factor C1-like [Dipodomys merriami]|uniref:doublesex- and mab-3-related transcription factor C1-like n=1 Tax=Dipodomys merriami TaxID=94247 RepID=UPI003855AAA3